MAPRTSPHRRPFRALLTIFATLVAVIAQQAVTQSPASAAATWNDGTPAYSTIWNCYSLMPGSTPYQELGLGVGLGASVDWPAQQPVPGQMFLLKVIMTSVGRTCSGNYVDVQFKLPTGVSTAITGTDKIKCFLRGQPVPVNQCPTALTAGSESGYLKLPAPPATMSEHPTLWPVPYAQTVEFHVPVRATQAMSNAQVLGRMDVLDGNARPMLRPTAGINVFAPATTPPGAPTGATATAGVNKATVTWSAPSNPGSSAITGYVVTPYRDGVAQSSVSASASARTLDVNGLDAGVSYTFRVAAVSAAGTGAQSGASNAVVPTAPVVTAPPGAPTGVTATAGIGLATVKWTAPSSSGTSPITGYRVTPFRNGVLQTPVISSGTGTSSVITGLTAGASYTFHVAAVSAAGTGAQSGASNAVVPTAPVVTAPPGAPTGVTATAGVKKATVKWSAPSNPGSSAITGYVVTPYRSGVAQSSVSASASARTLDVNGLDAGVSYTFRVAAKNAAGTSPLSGASNAVVPTAPVVVPGMVFVPVAPCRVYDSRATPSGAFASGAKRSIAITGSGPAFAAQGGKSGGCGVPAGAAAVEGSISAVAPAGRGFLRAWPSGASMPAATFVNFTQGRAVTNTGALTLRSDGPTHLDLAVFSSKTDVVVDVQGYFVPQSTAGKVFVPITPCRIADTRARGGALGPSVTRDFHVTGGGSGFATQGGVPGGCAIPAGAGAVEVSISAVGATRSGYTRVWPAGNPAPNATFLNHDDGGAITNTGAVPISSGSRQLSVKNFSSTSHYVIDVQGYFVPESGAPATATRFTPITPCRIADTRGSSAGKFTNGDQRKLAVAGGGSVFASQGGMAGGCGIPSNARAIEASFSAVGPSASGYVRTWPSGGAAASATFLNFVSASSVTNTGAVAVQPSAVDGMTVRSFGGPTNLVVDVQGYYAPS